MKDDEWLDRQLSDVLKELRDRHQRESLVGLDRSISSVVNFNEVMAGGRYDQAVAHLILAVSYAIHGGLMRSPGMMRERTLTDEQARELAFNLTWGDLESMFSQLGKTLWIALWRPK